MTIQELATTLGILPASARMACSRKGIVIRDNSIDDLIATALIHSVTKDCPQCNKRHSRKRFCSDECRNLYGRKGRLLRGRMHPMNSVHISGIKGQDRRIRLSDEDKEEIRYKHKNGQSITSLAKDYGVNKRAVQFVIYPERYEHAKMLARKRRSDGRYKTTKEQHRAMMADHRRHKREVLKALKKLP